FLVLLQKARSIELEDTLGPWLYQVASRVARRARSLAARRSARERGSETIEAIAPTSDLDGFDIAPILHAELTRLPEQLRAPIVMCYLEGLTHDQAAEQLRWPVGTVRSRLARARERLRTRLSRRGVCVSASVVAVGCQETAANAIPIALSTATIQAAMRIVA